MKPNRTAIFGFLAILTAIAFMPLSANARDSDRAYRLSPPTPRPTRFVGPAVRPIPTQTARTCIVYMGAWVGPCDDGVTNK